MIKCEIGARFQGALIFIMSLTVPLLAAPSNWYENDQMASLYEALTKISSESLYAEAFESSSQDIIKNYIHKIDDYGDYFSKKEYQAFQRTLNPQYAGVGMILYQKNRDGKFLCIPTKKSLKKKGLSRYDELISVNGVAVQGKNFYLVSSWIRGRKNSSIVLKVRKSTGELKNITLERSEQYFHSVKRMVENGKAMIQIIRFTGETPRELKNILSQWPHNIPIVIDLRGNGGGDFLAAIQSADLLLPKDALISTIETKKRQDEYRSSSSDFMKGKPIFILQDSFTASAAEVFIAALTQNKRAQSIGRKSFGKGVVQKFITLSNGGALLITYGKIITPNGKSYHRIGLSPTLDILPEAFKDNNMTSLF